MKRKLSKILGVGLTLSLLVSLLLTAAPVSADVSQPTVDLDEFDADNPEGVISKVNIYSVTFYVTDELAIDQWIEVRFPPDTGLMDSAAWGDADISIQATAGFGTKIDEDFVLDATTETRVTTDEETVRISLGDLPNAIGEDARVRVKFYDGVSNPDDPGTYTLEVQTSLEDTWVESEEYELDAPTLGGSVDVFNPSDIKVATFGGQSALDLAAAANYFDVDHDDFTIKVGAGTYVLAAPITIVGEGLTLESSDGAEDTILEDNGFVITGAEVTLDGFTIDGAATAVNIDAEDVTVTNLIILEASTDGIEVDNLAVNAVVTDNVLEDCATGISFTVADPAAVDLDEVEISGNEITGCDTNGAIVFDGGNVGIVITGNTITDNDVSGIFFVNGSGEPCDSIEIVGNTISGNDGIGIEVAEVLAADAPTNLAISENDILDNEDQGILLMSWDEATLTDYIMFNNISGNDTNLETALAVNARFNWWGSADEDDIQDELDGTAIEYEPWLTGNQADTVGGYAVSVNDTSSLDGKDDAGVSVSGMADDAAPPLGADIISAFQYAANPEDAIDDAIAFYDIFVVLDDLVDQSEVSAKLKFYDDTITEGATASFWTGDFWAECSDQESRDGIVYVSIDEDTVPTFDDLEGTAFVVVAGEAVTEFGAPALLAPAVGADDVSLTPTFAWGAVADAIGYDFEFADNANFVTPMVKLDGELGRLIVTAYAYVGELPYSTAYYWRVKAVSADAESDWASSVFITMDEPEEPTPPVVIEPYEPPEITIEQPDIIVQSPDVIVPLPAETPITPAWIYVIIGVGAVLVIALLVLIVRTRRVA